MLTICGPPKLSPCAGGVGAQQNSVLQLTSSQVSCPQRSRKVVFGRKVGWHSITGTRWCCLQQCGVTKHEELDLLPNEEEGFGNCYGEAEEKDNDEEEDAQAVTMMMLILMMMMIVRIMCKVVMFMIMVMMI